MNMDYPPKDEEGKKEPVKKGMSRGDFLKILGLAGVDMMIPEVIKGQFETESSESNLEIQDAELNKLIEEYIEQKTFLSKEEIKKSLLKCGFIEDLENINIQELEVKNPRKVYTDRDALKESMEESLIQLDYDKLNIIEVDFERIGKVGDALFYTNEYKSIFINQPANTKEKKRTRIENFIITEAVRIEYKLALSGVDENKKELLHELLEESKNNTKGVKGSDKLIEKNINEIKKSVKEFCASEMLNRKMTETNLPHEAFHYFYGTQLGKEGYEGPSVSELLVVAIRSYVKRFGINKNITYSKIDQFIENLYISNDEKILEFCKNLNGDNLLLDDSRKEKHDDVAIFSKFLNEYWATVYNGAVGNTPSFVKKEIETNDYINKQGVDIPSLDFEEMYHEPIDKELSILKEMKWNGKSIIKN